MVSERSINEARTEAQVILDLRDEDVAKLFFQQTMHRNLSRTVRHLERLLLNGAEDRKLGEAALKRLGFAAED